MRELTGRMPLKPARWLWTCSDPRPGITIDDGGRIAATPGPVVADVVPELAELHAFAPRIGNTRPVRFTVD